jgi:hypothetical protein
LRAEARGGVVVIEALAAVLMTLPLTGYVTPYADGVMERVMERRVGWHQVQRQPPGVCLAALNDAEHVGRWVTVEHRAGLTRCYVVDCARPDHAIERKMISLVLELDPASYAVIGRGPVRVTVQ